MFAHRERTPLLRALRPRNAFAAWLLACSLFTSVSAGAAPTRSTPTEIPPAAAASSSGASAPDRPTAGAAAKAFAQAVRVARASTLLGPGRVSLTTGLELVLPKDTEFIPRDAAQGLLEALGQNPGPDLLGLIQPHGQGDWMVSVRYEPVGRVDVPADLAWPEDRLLERLQDHLRHANGDAPGATPLITGWAQRPAFDAERHRLVWSVRLQRPARASTATPVPDTVADEWVNYNVHALGRHGVLSLGLTTPSATLARDKRLAHVLLAGVDFLPGERVQDGRPDDPVAPVSLSSFIVPEHRAGSGREIGLTAGLLVLTAGGLGYVLWRLQRRPGAKRRRPEASGSATGTAPAHR